MKLKYDLTRHLQKSSHIMLDNSSLARGISKLALIFTILKNITIKMVTSQETFRNLLNDFVPKDKWIHITEIYDIIERNIDSFQPNDLDASTKHNQQPKWKRNVRNALQKLKESKQILWNKNGNYLFSSIISEETESSTLPTIQRMTESQFLQIQERQKEIGRLGEEFVVDYERKKLVESGNLKLAKMVKRVSINDIGAGYDVLSFTPTGDKKYIEVKATSGDFNQPFCMSKNEKHFFEEYRNSAFIYRVYNFNRETRRGDVKIISKGELFSEFTFDTITWQVTPKECKHKKQGIAKIGQDGFD